MRDNIVVDDLMIDVATPSQKHKKRSASRHQENSKQTTRNGNEKIAIWIDKIIDRDDDGQPDSCFDQ